jgi:hypothetical protein
MIVIISILAVLVIILGYTTLNLMKKQEKSEDILAGYLEYLDKLSRVIEVSDKKIKELDYLGAFESDDETGIIFKNIKQIQDILNEFQIRK